MANTGIIIAMSKEFDSLESLLGKPETIDVQLGINVSSYGVGHGKVYVARCGIGEIYAAAAAALLISKYSVDEILNYGFAGALNGKYGFFDIISVKEVIHYDMDLTAFGNKIGQYDDRESELWSTDESLTSALISGGDFPSARIASADKFVRYREEKLALSEKYGADICDMESAGIAVVSNKAGIPFASIKLIADGIDGDSGEEFMRNADKGAGQLAEVVYRYLTEK